MALIDPPPVTKEVLTQLGLATEALTKSEETIWLPKQSTLGGPPEELFPLDRQGPPAIGPRAGCGSLHLSEPFFDELPQDDWAA